MDEQQKYEIEQYFNSNNFSRDDQMEILNLFKIPQLSQDMNEIIKTCQSKIPNMEKFILSIKFGSLPIAYFERIIHFLNDLFKFLIRYKIGEFGDGKMNINSMINKLPNLLPKGELPSQIKDYVDSLGGITRTIRTSLNTLSYNFWKTILYFINKEEPLKYITIPQFIQFLITLRVIIDKMPFLPSNSSLGNREETTQNLFSNTIQSKLSLDSSNFDPFKSELKKLITELINILNEFQDNYLHQLCNPDNPETLKDIFTNLKINKNSINNSPEVIELTELINAHTPAAPAVTVSDASDGSDAPVASDVAAATATSSNATAASSSSLSAATRAARAAAQSVYRVATMRPNRQQASETVREVNELLRAEQSNNF